MTVGQRAGVDAGILPDADGYTAAVGCFYASRASAQQAIAKLGHH